jgi:signal transduction histidine kinase
VASRRSGVLSSALIGAFAIALAITVLVGWTIIFTQYYILAIDTQVAELGVGYWLILAGGCVFLALVIAALVLFLVANIRQALYVRRQNTFVDSVTHELKSPLASLKLALDTMQLRELTAEQRTEFVAMMVKDVDRLQEFIEHVLEAGRLEHDQRKILWEPVSVAETVDRVVSIIHKRYDLSEDAIDVVLSLSDRSEAIYSDPMALDIILLNLLDNAIKYGGSEQRVAISVVEGEDKNLVITVRDHGIGIPKKQLKKIFRRFHRVHSPDAGTVQGTGLGLYVVRFLVQRLGGKVNAASDGVQQGSVFRVQIPLRQGFATK